MVPVILAVHSLIILALIGVVLLQRSDGGAALSAGNFMTGRGTANALTRTTSILAALFFTTSMALAIIAARGEKERSVIEDLTGVPGTPGRAPTSTEDLLKSLGADEPAAPSTTPPVSAPAAAPVEAAPAPEAGGDPSGAPSAEPAAESAASPAAGEEPAPPPQ